MPTENAADPIVIRGGESRNGAPFTVFGNLAYVKLSSRDTQGRFAICELIVEPNGGRPAQTHRYEDQWFYVIGGEIHFNAAGLRSVMTGGDSIYIPRHIPYRYDCASSTPARLLVVAVPGGLDLFYAEASRPSFGENSAAAAPIEGCLEKHGVVLAE
jgi:quercetin dioxygenase-like cupin family protein